MGNEVKPLVKTLRCRVKDRVSGKHLDAVARAVNLVWNHCNGAQRHALKHNTRSPTEGLLKRLTAGAGRLIGIPAQIVQGVCEEYIDRRRGSRKAKLRCLEIREWTFMNCGVVHDRDVVAAQNILRTSGAC
jgi:hypothetical protein